MERITVYLERSELNDLDAEVERRHSKRNTLLRALIKEWLTMLKNGGADEEGEN
jgi:metal-responsive CopG/Arc/MetJ family transcriptional regulator